MVRYWIAFLEGNGAEMDRVGAASESLSEIQDWIWGERAAVLAFSGHLKQARAMSQRAVEVALKQIAARARRSTRPHRQCARPCLAIWRKRGQELRRYRDSRTARTRS